MLDTRQTLDILRLLFRDEPFFGGGTKGQQSPIERGLILTVLVSLTGGKAAPLRILEVGSWIGFSALTWAEAIARFVPTGGEVLCVDQWTPYFTDVDMQGAGSPRYVKMNELAESGLAYALFLHNARCAPENVPLNHIRGASTTVLQSLPPMMFDIVYIDRSHYYADVKADITAAKALVAEGGILAGDDLEVQIGSDIDEFSVRQNLTREYVADPKGHRYHPGVTLAVAEEFGRVSAVAGTWFMRRRGNRFEPFRLDNARMILPRCWPPHLRMEARECLIERGMLAK